MSHKKDRDLNFTLSASVGNVDLYLIKVVNKFLKVQCRWAGFILINE